MEAGLSVDWALAYPAHRTPGIAEIGAYIRSPYWERLCGFIEETWGARPLVQYSVCSMAPGWNVKYRKGSRPICTLYPETGTFTCMVSVGGRQQMEAELFLAGCCPYLQDLYRDTKPFNGSRWLSIRVTGGRILEETMGLLRIRMKK